MLAEAFDLGGLIGQVGLPVTLVAFFVWNSARREERMAREFNALQRYVRDELMALARSHAEVIERNCAVMESVSTAVSNISEVLRDLERRAA